MKPDSEQKSNKDQKLPTFDLLVEIYDWLQIVFAALIVSLIIGLIVYSARPDKTGLILGLAVTGVALIVGIILANNVWKQKGITLFGPETKSSTELNRWEEPK